MHEEEFCACEAECPHCGADVPYDDWEDCDYSEEKVTCPFCQAATSVEDLYGA